MTMGEVVDFIERFATDSDAPVRTGTNVTSVRRTDDGYHVSDQRRRDPVPDRGRRQRRLQPADGAAVREAVPASVTQVTPFDYRDPGQLPAGGVLVVGASATGVQLAAELARSGRPVTLSVGEHVRLPRTYRGRDVLWWMDRSGVWDEQYDQVEDLTRARRLPSPQLVGTPERATLDLNALADLGVELVGRWAAVRDGRALFSGGLRNVFALADLKLERLLDTFDDWARDNDREADGRTAARALCAHPGSRVRPVAARSAQRRVQHDRVGHGLSAGLRVARRARGRPQGQSPTRRRHGRQSRACTRWGCRCCAAESPRSSMASRTTPGR